MSEYSELKRRAEHAIKHAHDSYKLPSEIAFEQEATPSVVLTLIAENQRLRALPTRNALIKQRDSLIDERDQLKAESKESSAVIDRLAKILAGVAVALKGEELPLSRHSYHDLVECVTVLKLENDLRKAENEMLSSAVSEWQDLAERRAQRMIALDGENEAMRKDAERLQKATAFVQNLCDSAGKQPSVATGYLHDILSALSKEPTD